MRIDAPTPSHAALPTPSSAAHPPAPSATPDTAPDFGYTVFGYGFSPGTRYFSRTHVTPPRRQPVANLGPPQGPSPKSRTRLRGYTTQGPSPKSRTRLRDTPPPPPPYSSLLEENKRHCRHRNTFHRNNAPSGHQVFRARRHHNLRPSRDPRIRPAPGQIATCRCPADGTHPCARAHPHPTITPSTAIQRIIPTLITISRSNSAESRDNPYEIPVHIAAGIASVNTQPASSSSASSGLT